MKYTKEEAFEEIRRRGREMKLQRKKRIAALLSAASGLVSCMLLAFLGLFSSSAMMGAPGSTYGSFLLSPQEGGYVLAGVIAFSLGVGLTLFVRWYREKGRKLQ